MRGRPGHAHSQSHSGAVNQRAQLANAYQELGKELSSERIKVVGNYTLGKVIGEGAYGKVRIGTHRLTSSRVAMKQIPKALSASLTREIHHHRRLHHPNVTQLYEVIATEASIWLVTELCSGGELYDYLVEKGKLPELETRQIFGELCLALHYVHTQGVVHRDLKLENVLLDERCHVKLSDFGFTREFENGRMLETFCGTTGYAAPEMLMCKKYAGAEVDVWSLGVILFCLLVGTLPFDDDDEEAMKQKIINEPVPDPEWLSPDVRDLIRGLLQKDPAKRLTVAQTLAHPWFSRPIFEEPDYKPLDSDIIDLSEDFSVSPAQPSPPILKKLEPITIPETSPLTSSPVEAVPNHEAHPTASSLTSDATFHSATSYLSQSDEGADLPATPADSAGEHDFARTALSVENNSADGHDADAAARTGSSNGPNIEGTVSIHRMESQSTIRKAMSDKTSPVDAPPPHLTVQTLIPIPSTVPEEEVADDTNDLTARPPSRTSLSPSTFPTRTPARTKRRSVNSNLTNSPPASPSISPPIAPLGDTLLPDYLAQSHVKAPLAFSTDLERNLLSSMSLMGFDTGQIVHSVLTDACDSASALWWMLKKKVERRELAEARKNVERAKAAAALEDRRPSTRVANKGDKDSSAPTRERSKREDRDRKGKDVLREERNENEGTREKENDTASRPSTTLPSDAPEARKTSLIDELDTRPFSAGIPISGLPSSSKGRPPVALMLGQPSTSHSSALGGVPLAPDVTFVPPTPVTISHESSASHTPDAGRGTPPGSNGFPFHLGVQPQTGSSPSASPERTKRSGKARSGSVSMLQRATTAVAGLTRKKSGEAVKDKEDLGSGTAGSSTGSLLRLSNADEARPSSAGSHPSNKLTKPPPNPTPKDKEREKEAAVLSPILTNVPSEITPNSPWAFPTVPGRPFEQGSPSKLQYRHSVNPAPTPANSPGGSLSYMSSVGKSSVATGSSSTVKGRNRASLISAFRTWFNDDRRKRKPSNLSTIPAGMTASYSYGPSVSLGGAVVSPRAAYSSGSIKNKRGSVSSARAKRPSVSSRRSSSMNSRRSSLNSLTFPPGVNLSAAPPNNLLARQRSDASRRSKGTRTPTSERDLSSRPSSIRSLSLTPITQTARQKRHSKSSSTSSGGSANPTTATPRKGTIVQQKYHHRGGSGSSTRVVRQAKAGNSRPHHGRTDSQASSVPSRSSSRPGSFHEASEPEGSLFGGVPRSGSPMLASRLSGDELQLPYNTVMVAHRKQSVFGSPSASAFVNSGRSSWKKSWGVEPPAWSSRSIQSHQERPPDPSRPDVRDVFTGRPSITGDDSDWVDEEDDEPAYVGGLGQAAHSLSSHEGKDTSSRSAASFNPHLGLNTAMPGSPSLKGKDLPQLAGLRSRPPSNATRNGRSGGFKTSESGSRHGRTSPTTPSTLNQETTAESASRGSRRQLPSGRGPAFSGAIQEEDEDEEE